jgi:hypothetical protein
VSERGDVFEAEAERVAAQVLKMQSAGSAPPLEPPPAGDSSVAGGTPLPASAREFFEPRFGHSFARVRVHTGDEAERSAREISALAYTTGSHIVFGAGQYDPGSAQGRHLLAHELTHVVQQGGAPRGVIQRSYGTAGPDSDGKWELPKPPTITVGPVGLPEVQRSPAPGDPQANPVANEPAPQNTGQTTVPSANPQGGAVPATATPTLTLAPGATLTRGDSLTATVSFTPAAGEVLNVTGWTYSTASQGDVKRPATDADFQTKWAGVMALSGAVQLDYTVTPAGGKATKGAPVKLDVTVGDRTGSPWESSVTDDAEKPFAGQPSPPARFNQLGHHDNTATFPNATGKKIISGPNTSFEYVDSLTQGIYTSSPSIHPDLNNAASAFLKFHQDASRLYYVAGTARTVIPLTEYSGLKSANGAVTFTVPNWEVFYKKRKMYTLIAKSGTATKTLKDEWWSLIPNTDAGNPEVTDDSAVRAALGISGQETYKYDTAVNGSFEGYELMPAAAILPGTQSHEYKHAVHSHRANFHAMMRALDPQRKVESSVSTPSKSVKFGDQIKGWWAEIAKPNHELVDEAASKSAGTFQTVSGQSMAAVNTNPDTKAFLGNVWNITQDQKMT